MDARKQKVLVWIYCRENGENLFLLLRTTPERGEFWQPVTGSVEPGESVEDAAAREVWEETGLAMLAPMGVSEPYEFESRHGLVREFPFLAEVDSSVRKSVKIDSHEHTAFQWCTPESALELLKYESNARVLRDVLNEIKAKENSA